MTNDGDRSDIEDSVDVNIHETDGEVAEFVFWF